MPKIPEYLTNVTEAQADAWRALNTAFGSLALSYSVDLDQLAESCGRYTEEIVSVLMDDGWAA